MTFLTCAGWISAAPGLLRTLAVVIALSLSAQAAAEPGPRWESLPWSERIGAAWFESQAEAGDVQAQYRLGEIYESGLSGAESDADMAIAWYRKAADQGHVRAAFRLGRLLERQADGGEEAAAAYRQASLAGLPEATYNLARLYRDGAGVARDFRSSERLYRQAYKGGMTRAALDLAQLALVGPGRDEVRALAWALRARDDGVPNAASLAERLTVLLTPEQVDEAQGLNRELP